MLEAVLSVFFTLLALIVLVIAMAYFWAWYYASPTQEDEIKIGRASCRERV